MSSVRTHGELPCPACGYARRGLEHGVACPECGAAGFHGDLAVSGQPETHRESRHAGCVFRIAHGLWMFGIVGAGFFLNQSGPWQTAIGIAWGALMAVALAIWIYGRIRRRSALAEGDSLERIAWDFETTGIRVREFGTERFVPYGDIRKCWTMPNFVFTRRTKVQLELRGVAARSGDYPTVMLGGSSEAQRDAREEMKRRIHEGKVASNESP